MFLERLASALAFAKQAGELAWDEEAVLLRKANYPRLKHSGDSIPHTDRMRAYVWRLAMLYALVDKSKTIRGEHYRAALAVVEYCRASARLRFGGSEQEQTPKQDNPLWLQVLNAILRQPGIKQGDLTEMFHPHYPSSGSLYPERRAA